MQIADLDFPIDVVLEGDFAPKAPALATSGASAVAATASASGLASVATETRAQMLDRLLTQVRERRRSAA